MARLIVFALTLVLGSVMGCVVEDTDPGPLGDMPMDEEEAGVDDECPEVSFTQGEGCQNDGSVEFCISADDPDLVGELREIAPTIEVVGAFTGRAGCDRDTELLLFYPTTGEDCTELYGGLVDAAWLEVCALAAHPSVTRVVATWYE